ncbi:Lipase 4 [Grifola frondosa]|uniref:Lipase 4 n=1 Tax=Grifola frondosa TaxID=5627 RepID=A0A1C7LN85_GRIFR|nr:Lipase 4 [Grifola frondosa]
MAAVDKTPTISSPQSLAISWFPRADGVFLKDDDEVLLSQGKVAEIPFVIGDVEDEGTLFSLSLLNITTDAEFVDYITGNYLHGLTSAEIDKLLELYPADPAVGSPYGTGNNFTFTKEYKRLASFQGDLIFQAPRRQMLQQLSCKVHTWSFISKRLKVPGIGAPHGTDLENVYGGGDMADYLIRFVSTLNPNGATGIDWPPYTEGALISWSFSTATSH